MCGFFLSITLSYSGFSIPSKLPSKFLFSLVHQVRVTSPRVSELFIISNVSCYWEAENHYFLSLTDGRLRQRAWLASSKLCKVPVVVQAINLLIPILQKTPCFLLKYVSVWGVKKKSYTIEEHEKGEWVKGHYLIKWVSRIADTGYLHRNLRLACVLCPLPSEGSSLTCKLAPGLNKTNTSASFVQGNVFHLLHKKLNNFLDHSRYTII